MMKFLNLTPPLPLSLALYLSSLFAYGETSSHPVQREEGQHPATIYMNLQSRNYKQCL